MKSDKAKKYEIDMCSGPLLGKILVFALPLMLSGILQLLFNAADIVVVGRFAGSEALAAVGSTSSLINLIVNLFMGLSVGVNVLVARLYGAGQKEELGKMVGTATAIAGGSGLFLVFAGFFISKPALVLMGTPETVIRHSVLYMRIYFAGMPFMMVYNFGSAVLRAVGDTRRPLYYLLLAGVANVMLNLLLVIVFRMGVAGVALATVLSQMISAVLVLGCLIKTDGSYRLDRRNVRLVPDKLGEILRIGLPAGIQGVLFSLSNVVIQSSINSFGPIVMAGNTAACNIEGFIYTSMSAFGQLAVSFCGQNYGAGEYKRVGRILLICEMNVITLALLMRNGVYFFGGTLLRLYSTDPEVISYGILRMSYICSTCFLAGMVEVIVGTLRGMGYSITPMLISLTGTCLLRVVWVSTIFREYRTPDSLYLSYPVSWALSGLAQFVCFAFFYARLFRRKAPEYSALQE